jgi:hypothetical protein
LLSNGLLKGVENYFSLPSGYYGLSSLFIILSFLLLLRVKSLEGVRYLNPGELGKVVGLDRIPEVKTLREKLEILSRSGDLESWQSYLSRSWLESNGELFGTLYVDGHVRVYYGSQTRLPRRYVSRERLCLRGMTDYWVNDALGQPFFVISTALTCGLLSVLRNDIIPRLIDEIPNQPDEEGLNADKYLHRFIVVFDREGYSPDFMNEMRKLRIACITYKKFPGEDWREEEFVNEEVQLLNGEKVEMKLAERGIFLGKKIWVREIRKLTDNGHQTSIICTEFKSERGIIAATMFSRWAQENFFKYMMEHYGIDRLIDYQTKEISDTSRVVNPEYRALDSQIRSKTAKLSRLYAKFGSLTLSDIDDEKLVIKYQKEKSKLQEEITFEKKNIDDLKQKRKGTRKHIEFFQLPEKEKFSKVGNEKKQFMDTLKMIAYRAETALANIIRPKMARKDEARALIRQIFNTEIDISPDKKNKVLNVYLHNLTNEGADLLAKEICEKLNQTETLFPGTNLKIIYNLVSNKNHRGQVF